MRGRVVRLHALHHLLEVEITPVLLCAEHQHIHNRRRCPCRASLGSSVYRHLLCGLTMSRPPAGTIRTASPPPIRRSGDDLVPDRSGCTGRRRRQGRGSNGWRRHDGYWRVSLWRRNGGSTSRLTGEGTLLYRPVGPIVVVMAVSGVPLTRSSSNCCWGRGDCCCCLRCCCMVTSPRRSHQRAVAFDVSEVSLGFDLDEPLVTFVLTADAAIRGVCPRFTWLQARRSQCVFCRCGCGRCLGHGGLPRLLLRYCRSALEILLEIRLETQQVDQCGVHGWHWWCHVLTSASKLWFLSLLSLHVLIHLPQ
jgi:hypothetical protein